MCCTARQCGVSARERRSQRRSPPRHHPVGPDANFGLAALRETGDLVAAALGDQRPASCARRGRRWAWKEAISHALANIIPETPSPAPSLSVDSTPHHRLGGPLHRQRRGGRLQPGGFDGDWITGLDVRTYNGIPGSMHLEGLQTPMVKGVLVWLETTIVLSAHSRFKLQIRQAKHVTVRA